MKIFLILNLFFIFGCASPTSDKLVTPPSICQEGTTRTGYTTHIALNNSPCAIETQTCISGNWQGHQLYEACQSFTKNCDDTLHGSTKIGYLASNSPKGVPCVQTVKTCMNGNWIGPEVFESCTELP